ncbi:2-amino-3-carboxymuconate-6-semialdehyde decarboxylase, putative [Talaromyces stipitatus ATCC 10500]|uniref:2-amino-3-carboxymuconate-6-semialdehyde decarboxylase, putative n=1 Tax=Talaromyces stipitatus (strain ATCC 10500 / CBS 375.48 / QM 6759 / NRRL 1006) TaxID=441959 RepID=B8MU03_TALSN|nr:2-amino-3-carboxymuconate-6-semialdehyde decarboxylase, putative [Talaromyces stipitatus ATCC 10500]EED12636.1 2-amino-3-carboxymuconate-6-semialdehyde decarboxylase, putative [Talaromyces stipitatus ATCC 10500]
MTPIITLEEHYLSSAVRNASKTDHYAIFPPHIVSKLNSLSTERIQDLDKGHVSLQVISHGPGDQPPEICKASNDELASAIFRNPTRFAGFALLPMAEPTIAAEELERCALIDNHTKGWFYDDQKFWPVFEKAQELDVPIYIHPSYPEEGLAATQYKGNYDDNIAIALGAYGWAWHADTALSILRLYASGFFDIYPKIKLILGHMGEMLPFQLDRVAAVSSCFGKNRPFKEVWTSNIWVTTSGMFALPPLACLLQTMPIERVLYSVDYPFSANEKGYEFLEEIGKSGLIKEGEEWERFLYKNAQELLKVKV